MRGIIGGSGLIYTFSYNKEAPLRKLVHTQPTLYIISNLTYHIHSLYIRDEEI
jgi:hypothetical protein